MQHLMRRAVHRVLSFCLVAHWRVCPEWGNARTLYTHFFTPGKPFNYSFLSLFGCILAI